MTVKEKQPLRCTFDLRPIPPQAYRLPNDGRKWMVKCKDRRSMIMQFATYANPDGTGIEIGSTRMCAELGLSRAMFFKRLSELENDLHFITTEGKTSSRGTAIRRLNLETMQAKMAEVETPESQIGESKSQIEVESKSQIGLVKVSDSHLSKSRIGSPESQIEGSKSPLARDSTATVHTPTHTDLPGTEKSNVCVLASPNPKPSTMEPPQLTADSTAPVKVSDSDAEKWIVEILANQPNDWSIGDKHRKGLKVAAKHLGREMFFAVARMYISEPPNNINPRTTTPWAFFQPNLEKYVKLVHKAKAAREREAAERPALEKQNYLLTRKNKVRFGATKYQTEFLASLTQEERDYINKVDAATTVEDLPADNGKEYEPLRYKFMCDQMARDCESLPPSIDDF